MESDLNNLQSTQHIATVHIRFCFYWMCIGFYGNAVALLCLCYKQQKHNTDVVLPSRLHCSIIFRLVRQRQKRRKLEFEALFCADVSTTLLFFIVFSKHKKVRILAVYCFFFCLTCTSQRHKLVSAKTSNTFMFYVAWGCEKATLIWSDRSDWNGFSEMRF